MSRLVSIEPTVWMNLGVACLLIAGLLGLVGPKRLRWALSKRHLRTRIRSVWPAGAVLGLVVGAKLLWENVSQEVSWAIGIHLTDLIYTIEGDLVASLQAVAFPELTAFFAFVYLAGFSFLLTFPFLAYFVSADGGRAFRELCAAFSVNYFIGGVCYTLFIVWGPRNFLPDSVDPLLYTFEPEAYLIMSAVTAPTNVFPSLHTSFAVTVGLLAWRTRDTYRGWMYVSTIIATWVVVATMYLGIHWAIDVVAGIVLAWGAVWFARGDPLADLDKSVRAGVSRHVGTVLDRVRGDHP